ncbi:MAG: methyltransferase domain-containing protein [Candidatus Eremiobacteraeota bacterium]|nr:methyltransferase domain-containing protein [Candidatus Eremiobacteraeota bacterium]
MTLGTRVDFMQGLFAKVKRNYASRMDPEEKAHSVAVASKFGQEYWDGERRYGFGGYTYDGRWRPLVEELVRHYNLRAGDRVLEIGCGKGYLLYEFTQAVPGITVAGLDISSYAIEHGKEELRGSLQVGSAVSLPYADDDFDLVISFNTLHNLGIADLFTAIGEVERVGSRSKFISVESFRDEREKTNLLYWQLTCKSFYSIDDWEWIYGRAGYTGDYGFVFFE